MGLSPVAMNPPLCPASPVPHLLEQILEGGFVQQSSSQHLLVGALTLPGPDAVNGRFLVVQPVPVAEVVPGEEEKKEKEVWG